MNCECRFCGKPREPLEVFGKVIAYKPCTCPEALNEVAVERMKEQRRKEEALKEAQLHRYIQCGIRKRFLDADAECDECVARVSKGESLYISGEVGSGKTYLASSIAKKLIDRDKKVLMLSTVEALDEIQASYDANGQSVQSVMACFRNCDVLVLDDLGKEAQSKTGWTESMLFRIIDGRYSDMRPVVITSQFTTLELIKRLSKNDEKIATAIVSRLIEMSYGIHLDKGDRRLEKKGKMQSPVVQSIQKIISV